MPLLQGRGRPGRRSPSARPAAGELPRPSRATHDSARGRPTAQHPEVLQSVPADARHATAWHASRSDGRAPPLRSYRARPPAAPRVVNGMPAVPQERTFGGWLAPSRPTSLLREAPGHVYGCSIQRAAGTNPEPLQPIIGQHLRCVKPGRDRGGAEMWSRSVGPLTGPANLLYFPARKQLTRIRAPIV